MHKSLLTVLVESSFVSSSEPLVSELLRCSLSPIDGSRDPLCSSPSFLLDVPVSSSPPVLLKSVGGSLPYVHVCSFFLSSLRLLCFELLKLVPPFLFFFFLPGSAVHTTLFPRSFICASLFPNTSLSPILCS